MIKLQQVVAWSRGVTRAIMCSSLATYLMADASSPRRWWQRTPVRFSVRALMVLVLIAAVVLAWVVRRAHIQRDAVAAIERAGGKAYYSWQVKRSGIHDYLDLQIVPEGQPRWPKWLVDRVGVDYFGAIKFVMVLGPADPVMPQVGQLDQIEELDFFPSRQTPGLGPTDVGMAHLRDLTQLKHLKLGVNGTLNSKITGRGLAVLSSSTQLQYLRLQGIPCTDSDLAILRGLTDLRYLDLRSTNVTDAGLESLAALVELRSLNLQETRVTAAGLSHLRRMTRLTTLNLTMTQVDSLEPCRSLTSLTGLTLARTPITDTGLVPLSSPTFAALTNLNLFQTHISDAGLTHLNNLPKLKLLNITGTDVTPAGVASFKQAQPKTNVVTQPPPARIPSKRVAK